MYVHKISEAVETTYWHELLDWCTLKGVKVGLIGAAPSTQVNEYNAGETENELIEKYGKEDDTSWI